MKSTPLIDIIIPVYNRAEVVEKTLRSVGAQTVWPARVILVDNNSTDGTLQVLQRWAGEMLGQGLAVDVLVESEPGAAAARNRGLDRSTAEYVMYFDSDDVMLPEHVESFARHLETRPETDVAGKSDVMTLVDGRRKTGHFFRYMPEFFNVFTGQFSTLRVVMRRSVIECAGRWNTTVRGWDDIELGQRVLLLKPVITVVSGAPTAEIEVMADSITEQRFSDNPWKWEHALSEMRRTASDAGCRRLVDWIDCRRMMLAATYSAEGDDAEAARLRGKILEDNPNHRRLQLIYRYHRRFRRFTWLLCRAIF